LLPYLLDGYREACIKENESNVSQAKIAAAGSISVVTLRKRFSDILRIIPRHNGNNSAQK
jgi:hypothetical protein